MLTVASIRTQLTASDDLLMSKRQGFHEDFRQENAISGSGWSFGLILAGSLH